MKRALKTTAFAAFALAIFSCGSTKDTPKPPEEPVSESLPDWSKDKDEAEAEAVEESAEAVSENEGDAEKPAETDFEPQPAVESNGTFSAERIEPENEMVGVKKDEQEQKSGDYPNMDRSKAAADESEIPRGTNPSIGVTGARSAPKSGTKKVAVAKKPEDIVVVDDLPNIVQENESVLFSSDWDEESLSDPEDCGYFYTTDNLGEFSMIKGEFRKLGGYEGSTVGFVFGFSPTKDGWLKDYIRFEINTRGEYGIYSWDGKKYTDLVQKNKPDTAYLYESAAINAGYNRKNSLTIQKEKDGTYTLSINDTVVAKKVPPLKKGTKGVMAFFSVGKEEQENFPEDPVTVTYRVTDSKK